MDPVDLCPVGVELDDVVADHPVRREAPRDALPAANLADQLLVDRRPLQDHGVAVGHALEVVMERGVFDHRQLVTVPIELAQR